MLKILISPLKYVLSVTIYIYANKRGVLIIIYRRFSITFSQFICASKNMNEKTLSENYYPIKSK